MTNESIRRAKKQSQSAETWFKTRVVNVEAQGLDCYNPESPKFLGPPYQYIEYISGVCIPMTTTRTVFPGDELVWYYGDEYSRDYDDPLQRSIQRAKNL